MAIPIPNPFDDVDDETLYQMQVSLEYGCLRSKAILTKQHKTYVCALNELLRQQAKERGSKSPTFPFPP